MEAGRACRFAQARLQAGLPAPCRPLQTRLNLSQHPWEGRQGEGEAGEERQVFPTPPSLRAGGVGEGRPRPPEAAVRSRQGGQTWVRCKNRAAAATAHGFTQQQQLSLPMWIEPKAERPLRWGPDALQSQTSGQPMQRGGGKVAIGSGAGCILHHPNFYSTLPNRTSSDSPEWLLGETTICLGITNRPEMGTHRRKAYKNTNILYPAIRDIQMFDTTE